MAVMDRAERAAGLDTAAEALVVAAKQLGADEQTVIDAVHAVWRRF
jgi:hypothetical protein